MNWKSYNELAWTDTIVANEESYTEEAAIFVKAIKKHLSVPSPTLLHMGCGQGGHDFHFKKHFKVTGVDLSAGMLVLARMKNPEVTYIKGDMRTVKLNEKFDIVTIPDSIMYMTTLDDLKEAITNSIAHMKPNGVILIVAHMKEEFVNNNFAYTGEKENTHITVFENNHIVSDTTYEATMVYLIRQAGNMTIQHEVHTLGLFSYEQWMEIFEECRLTMEETNANHLYDKFLLEEGEYKLKIFVGTKRG